MTRLKHNRLALWIGGEITSVPMLFNLLELVNKHDFAASLSDIASELMLANSWCLIVHRKEWKRLHAACIAARALGLKSAVTRREQLEPFPPLSMGPAVEVYFQLHHPEFFVADFAIPF